MLESITLKISVLENQCKIMVPLFGAAYAAPNKVTTILYRFMPQKTVLNPHAMVKFKDFSRPLSVFQVLLKANFIFKDFSRRSLIFKYFSSLCEPCYMVIKRKPDFVVCDQQRHRTACTSRQSDQHHCCSLS